MEQEKKCWQLIKVKVGDRANWSVWSDYGDNYKNLTEEQAYQKQDELQRKYKLSDEEVLDKIYLQDMSEMFKLKK